MKPTGIHFYPYHFRPSGVTAAARASGRLGARALRDWDGKAVGIPFGSRGCEGVGSPRGRGGRRRGLVREQSQDRGSAGDGDPLTAVPTSGVGLRDHGRGEASSRWRRRGCWGALLGRQRWRRGGSGRRGRTPTAADGEDGMGQA